MKVTYKQLHFLRQAMIWLNLIIVLYTVLTLMFASRYIVYSKMSYEFLTQINTLPTSPKVMFAQSVASYATLAGLMIYRDHADWNDEKCNWSLFVEFFLTLMVVVALRINYNGIFLLYFVDLFISFRNIDKNHRSSFWLLFTGLLLVAFSLTNNNFLGSVLSTTNLSTYINFMPRTVRTTVNFFNNFLNVLNLILFMTTISFFWLYLLSREHEVQDQLRKANKVNLELENYSALSSHIAEDRERKRIARDLHDTVGHALTGIGAGLQATEVLIDIDPEKAKEQLAKMSKTVQTGLSDVRKSLNKIRPGALEQYTLKAALTKMVKEYADISHIKIDLEYNWSNDDFEKTTEDVIFRIIEESITNSLRHGHADHVKITCRIAQGNYEMIIQDNGIGAKKIKPGFGLTQMRERVAIIGGVVEFSGQHGFCTKVIFPTEGENHD